MSAKRKKPDRSPSAAVIYAADDGAEHLHMLVRSVRSLRAIDHEIPVVLGTARPPAASAARELSRLGVTVAPLELPARTWGGISVRQQATFLKWHALGQLGPRFDQVLYLDGDTECFAPPSALMRKLRAVDFAAREDVGKQRHRRAELIGSFLALPEVDWGLMTRTRQAYSRRALDLPVFNTGVMSVSRRCAAWISEKLPIIDDVCTLWMDGKIPYPSSNKWVMEELAASVMLSTMTSMKWRRLTRQESPLYVELRGNVAKSPGTVVHVWSHFYPFFLEDFHGRATRRSFERRFAGER